MNNERVGRGRVIDNVQFAERKNLTAARLEGHRRGEQAGVRKGIVMGVLAGGFAVFVVLALQGRVSF